MSKLFINSFQNFLIYFHNRCILKILFQKLINNIYKIFNE